MTGQTLMRQPAGAAVAFHLEAQTGTTTIRTTPNGTRFHITGFSYAGGVSGGSGGQSFSLQVNGITIWASRTQNANISTMTNLFAPLNHVHVGDGVEIIRIVGGTAVYSCTLMGFDT